MEGGMEGGRGRDGRREGREGREKAGERVKSSQHVGGKRSASMILGRESCREGGGEGRREGWREGGREGRRQEKELRSVSM